MNPLLKKLSTKPVWWYERQRNYPVRKKWRRLPPLTCSPDSDHLAAVLSTPATIDDAIWSAYTWCDALGPEFSVMLIVDGEQIPDQAHEANALIGNLQLKRTHDLALAPSYPDLDRFSKGHPLGRKACALLSLSERYHTIYSDSDVLVFNQPRELLRSIESKTPCYNAEEKAPLDQNLLKAITVSGHNALKDLNSGLLFLPKGQFDLTLADQFMSKWSEHTHSWFTEMTLLSSMMHRADAKALPLDQYVVNTQRQFWWEKDVDYSTINTRHFTGPVRHVMYRNALPYLVKKYCKNG